MREALTGAIASRPELERRSDGQVLITRTIKTVGIGEGTVDEQTPDVLERHPADQILDVDAAIAQCRALLVRFGDLGVEGNDTFETVLNLALRI